MEESMIKKALKCLCLSKGWSFGAFWRFDQRNPILLTLQETYLEEHARSTINDMLLQVHVVGEGIIGKAAFDQKHRWMISDTSSGKWQLTGHQSQDRVEGDSEFCHPFSSGIKTVVLIPMESRGVVQFGSTQEILEEPEFVVQTRKIIRERDNSAGLAPSENAPSFFVRDTSDLNGLLASMISSHNSFYGNSSTTFIDMGYAGASAPTSFGQNEDSTFLLEPSISATCADAVQNMQFDSVFDPFCMGAIDLCSAGELVSDKYFNSLVHETKFKHEEGPSSLHLFEEEHRPADHGAPLFGPFQLDDAFPSLGASVERCETGLDALIIENLLHAEKSTSISPVLAGTDVFCSFPSTKLTNSSHSQNSMTNYSGGKGKSLDYGTANNELCQGFSPDFAFEDPVVDKKIHSGSAAGVKGCSCEVEGGSITGIWERLFSELGLEKLMDDEPGASCVTKSSTEVQCSLNKRRRTEGYSTLMNKNQTRSHSLGMKSVQPMNNLQEKADDFGLLKDFMPTAPLALWSDDTYSASAKSCISTTQPKRAEEPPKAIKKRVRPGESTRPRPKDRQMIQDRVKELREIIPNGAKCSIDSLLDRTIKHMLFLQSLTKYADKLKQVNEPKLICQENSVDQKSKPNCSGSSGGATWALEAGGQSLFCPIVVEDLGHPGQMLIEMLCEDKGFFLEIADLIRGFGLTILKGVMEVRHHKIWAHYIVEANRHITRIDILMPLIQLMQDAATSGMNTTNEPSKVLSSTAPDIWHVPAPGVTPC
ncbi:hypothetical protein Ancab_015553 [Ancistrocladus abbreviatus]